MLSSIYRGVCFNNNNEKKICVLYTFVIKHHLPSKCCCYQRKNPSTNASVVLVRLIKKAQTSRLRHIFSLKSTEKTSEKSYLQITIIESLLR